MIVKVQNEQGDFKSLKNDQNDRKENGLNKSEM